MLTGLGSAAQSRMTEPDVDSAIEDCRWKHRNVNWSW